MSAILHTGWPIRYWDSELGAESPRLLLLDAGWRAAGSRPGRRLRAPPGRLHDQRGRRAGHDHLAPPRPARTHAVAVAVVDVATGARTVVEAPGDDDYDAPVISPDGGRVAVFQGFDGSYDEPVRVGLATSRPAAATRWRAVLGDLSPTEWAWSPDSRELYVAGDLHGHGVLVALDPITGAVRRTLASDAAYLSLIPAPDGRSLYALRSAMDSPPYPVRLDAAPRTRRRRPASPGADPALPGELIELTSRAMAARPSTAGCPPDPAAGEQAPVMLWIHGGPFGRELVELALEPVGRGGARLGRDGRPGPLHRLRPTTGSPAPGRYRAADVYADCEAVLDAVLSGRTSTRPASPASAPPSAAS